MSVLSLYPGDNEDTVDITLAFLQPRELSRVGQASVGASWKCEQDRFWKPHADGLKTSAPVPAYPPKTPLKKLYAAHLYGHLNYRDTIWSGWRVQCWNISSSKRQRRGLGESIRWYAQRNQHWRGVRRGAAEALNALDIKNTLARAMGFDDDALRRAQEVVAAARDIKRRLIIAEERIDNGRARLKLFRKKFNHMVEMERLHKIFTPYLRYYWFYAQTMKDQPAPFAGPVAASSTHPMVLRSSGI